MVLHSKSKTAMLLGLTAATVSALAVMSVHQFGALDADIFGRLLAAYGLENVPFTPSGRGEIFSIPATIITGTAATYIVFRLVGPPRFIACAGLFTLTLMYQRFAFTTQLDNTHPLGFIVALLGGILGGLPLRAYQNQQRQTQAHVSELKLKNRELLETRLELLKQDEVERRILAADLHDQVLNDLKQVAHRFEKYTSEPDAENAEKIKVLTAQVMREIREVMDSLSPSVLEHLGLGAAIEDCLRRGSERSNFRTRFKSRIDNEELDCLSMVEKGLLYRLVQESITNICKHAGATTVRATMEAEGDEMVIRVTDDGKGMDPAMARGDSRGMKYMRYRADLIGATMGWKPGEGGKGTMVEIRINLGDRRAAQAAAALKASASAQQSETQV